MANPARAYLTTQVETTTQGELLIMLYEAAIKFLKRAKMEIDNKDYAKKGIYISKAMAIIHELSESLNKEKGGEITPKLASLYQFCTSQLVKANIRMDTRMVDEVIKILDGLRSAYAQIVPVVEGKTAPGEAQSTAKAAPPIAPTPQQLAASQMKQQQPTAQPATAPDATEKQSTAPNQTDDQKPAAPAQPKPTQPPKIRTAANAAKFRAANAYFNANR